MDFAAIDFETANRFHESPCAVGVVVVRQWEIVEEASFLILPHRDFRFFEPMNVRVHGITPRRVLSSPEFPDALEDVISMVQGLPLVAHNARFDLEVLMRTMALYSLGEARFDWVCSLRLARRAFRLRRCGLESMAEHLGFPFNHHDPLDDARLCAKVAMASLLELGMTLEEAQREAMPPYRTLLSQVEDRRRRAREMGHRRPAPGDNGPEMLDLDVISRSGFFRPSGGGSEAYFTTLYSCTCPYHLNTRRECKHMRALREALGGDGVGEGDADLWDMGDL